MTTAEVFEYLDDLRESGVTNMFGAGSYLETELGLTRDDARRLLLGWMATFSRDTTAEDRAAAFEADAAARGTEAGR